MDGRRTRWHAWDADFLGGKLGVGIRQRYGVVGIVVFLAFVSACKRNHVQGQITYHTPEEGLSMMGLPGLRLVNEQGEQWTLDMLWTYCGQQKVTSRRHRGDLTDILSTRWRRWQIDYGRQVEAEKKKAQRHAGDTSDTSQTPLGDLSDTTTSHAEDLVEPRKPAGQPMELLGRYEDANPSDKDIDKDIDKDQTKTLADKPADVFPEFWSAYPRKVAKGAAVKAWKTASHKIDPTEIVVAAERYAADPNLPPATYIPHASKWLNDERWLDGPLASRTAAIGNSPRGNGALELYQDIRSGRIA